MTFMTDEHKDQRQDLQNKTYYDEYTYILKQPEI
jgi:hypothetical protein